ncbi:MAG: M23 family metallopeptidase, partial [Deltaproteobacteria bacterium]|nr:M23 family metallopeptidase [Deltaproteobacteria bacterium]
IELNTDEGVFPTGGVFMERPFYFYKKDESYIALLGVGLSFVPGTNTMDIELQNEDGDKRKFFYMININEGTFKVSRITVPKKMVNPPKNSMKRIINEKEVLSDKLSSSQSEKLWEGEFITPTKGKVTSRFGVKRFLNGKPKSPHSGLDIKAVKGTPVYSSNSGVVSLVSNSYFTGNTIVIDHGLELFTVYAHLSKTKVKEGDKVKKGERIGSVGSTGRSTGPHLHWGVKVNGMNVNPESLRILSSLLEG